MSWTYNSNTYENRKLVLQINEVVDRSSNSSTLNWTLTSQGAESNYYTVADTKIMINGVQVYYKPLTSWNTYEFPAKAGSVSGKIVIKHDANGQKTNIPISFTTGVYRTVSSEYAGNVINLTNIQVYTLSVSAGVGSNITATRTASGFAETGIITNGAKLYYGDTIKLTFSAEPGYIIDTHTVNGSTFVSGNTYTVSSNVVVAASASMQQSIVQATDASIGSVSTLTITKSKSSYTHTITYEMGSATGTICTKSGAVSIAWAIPTSFYNQIPDSKTGVCALKIETFSGNTSLGYNTSSLIVTASSDLCSPVVSGAVEDVDTDTLELTGDSLTLVKYKSSAQCTITATARNASTISSLKINGISVQGTSSGNVYTAILVLDDIDVNTFVFEATDSRGYTSYFKRTATMVNYIPLTLNPTIRRLDNERATISLSFNGNVYTGDFGDYLNTIKIRYRYRLLNNPVYSNWVDISSSQYTVGTNTFGTTTPIQIGDDFDTEQSYSFQIQVYDGNNNITLSTVTKREVIKKSIPTFDWGENDFTFHVPIKIGDTELTEEKLIQLLALLS